jgi:hypothetical protein
MRKIILLLNVAAAGFSFWWLGAHVARGLVGDWEFWFAVIYCVVTVANLLYVMRDTLRPRA